MVNNISFLGKVYRYLAKHAWVIFVLWAFWLTVEYLGLGPFSYIRIHDLGDSNLPMRLGLIQGFFQHGFSCWFPYAVCGIDRLAMGVNLFRVDSLLFFTLPGWFAYGFITFLQRFLAGYFTYRLCRECLKLDRAPSVVAGLAYSISFSWLLYAPAHHAMLYGGFAGELGFPLILWALERIASREGVTRYLFAFLLGLFAVFSSSFALSVPFILPMALAWFVLVRRQYSFRFLCLYAVFAATLILGKTPSIWAMLANAALSHRGDRDLSSVSWEVWSEALMNSIRTSLDFLIKNVVYWGLGLLGLFWVRFKERRLVWILLLLGFCGIAARFWGPFSLIFKPYMGFFSGFQFNRFYNLAPFFAAITVGYGLHLLFKNWVLTPEVASNTRKWRVQTVLCTVVIGLLVFHSFQIKYYNVRQWGTGNSYAVNYRNTDLQHLATTADSTPFRVATVADGLHPAYANAYGLETVGGYVGLYPQRYQDFWEKVIEPLTSQDENRYHYFHDWGNRVYLFSPSDGFDDVGKIEFSKYYNLNLLSLANARYIISRKPLTDKSLTLLPSQIPQPVRAWGDLSTMEKIGRGLKNNLKGRGLYIYRNESCLPRFFLADQVEAFQDSSQLLEAMAGSDIEKLYNSAFLEGVVANTIDVENLGFAEGRVVVSEYSPDRICLAVELDGSSILVISNSYSPYWKARVDGIEKDVFPVDHAFCGVYLEKSSKNVVLDYRPPYLAFY